jgi:hypothetical protein
MGRGRRGEVQPTDMAGRPPVGAPIAAYSGPLVRPWRGLRLRPLQFAGSAP